MFRFIVKRIAISLFVVFLVSVFAFSLMHFLPGDPARLALGEYASEEDVQALRVKLNLDLPIFNQYVNWLGNVLKGDFGYSLVYNRQIGDLLKERLPRTLAIGIPALIISVIVGICFGTACAIHRGKRLDRAITFISTIGIGTPVFWVGIICIYIFAMRWKVFPIQGFVSPSTDFFKYLHHAFLPVFCLSIGLIATTLRQTRSNMLEVINQDYIRTAKANGIKQRSIVFKHALKNALIPVITIIALQVRSVVGGSLIVENVFNIAGVGSMLNKAVTGRDYLVVQACVLIISLTTMFCNLIVDILYGVLNPQARLGDEE